MSARTAQAVIVTVLAVLSVAWFIGVLAGWWPYLWWTAFGLGQP